MLRQSVHMLSTARCVRQILQKQRGDVRRRGRGGPCSGAAPTEFNRWFSDLLKMQEISSKHRAHPSARPKSPGFPPERAAQCPKPSLILQQDNSDKSDPNTAPAPNAYAPTQYSHTIVSFLPPMSAMPNPHRPITTPAIYPRRTPDPDELSLFGSKPSCELSFRRHRAVWARRRLARFRTRRKATR